jgi:hypothetical protein
MVIAIVLLILNIVLAFMRKDEAAPVFAVDLCIWALCACYCYKRRHEFKRWIWVPPLGKRQFQTCSA